MSTTIPAFGRLVATRRASLGLSQGDIADYMGITQTTVSRWESKGLEAMSPHDIHRLARRLEVPPVIVAASLGYPVISADDALSGRTVDELAYIEQIPRGIGSEQWRHLIDYAYHLAQQPADARPRRHRQTGGD